jgi:hypothetical protein
MHAIGQLPRVGGGNIRDERTAVYQGIRSALTRSNPELAVAGYWLHSPSAVVSVPTAFLNIA